MKYRTDQDNYNERSETTSITNPVRSTIKESRKESETYMQRDERQALQNNNSLFKTIKAVVEFLK